MVASKEAGNSNIQAANKGGNFELPEQNVRRVSQDEGEKARSESAQVEKRVRRAAARVSRIDRAGDRSIKRAGALRQTLLGALYLSNCRGSPRTSLAALALSASTAGHHFLPRQWPRSPASDPCAPTDGAGLAQPRDLWSRIDPFSFVGRGERKNGYNSDAESGKRRRNQTRGKL